MANKFHLYSERSSHTLLNELPLAQALNPIQREALAKHLQVFELQTGDIIIHENQQNDFLFFVCEGSLNVKKRGVENNPKTLQDITAGKIAGEASFFDHEPASAIVTANEKTLVLALERWAFMQLSQESPHTALALSLEIFRLLSQRLRRMSGTIVNLI